MIKTFFSFLQFYLRNKGVLHISENMQKLYDWRKPVKPYAFIRLHNEIKTVDACLHSILPILKGGVIGFNSCTDGTKEYILEFCKKYPQFIPAEYPHYLIPANDKKYKEDNIDINSRLDTYYNFVWSKLPQNEWIIKIDGDHIWDLENTIKLCKLVIRKKDCVILNRINLHCVNEQVYIHKKVPLFEPGDSWLLYNNGKINFTFRRGWNDNEFFAWECLELPRKERRKIYGVLSNYHFPLVKSHRSNFNTEEWVLLQDYDLQKYIIENNMQGRVPDDMISTERIIAEFKKFNHENE
ncbi:hypothetical protein ACNGTO_04395 [Bisgaard Taxon 45]|uniref:Beta-1,4-N-acetylgalactosaminyltransferase n=1 Tax=Bisgaard Taxon 45 TaxID=304289 RepID=A0ABT9KGA3_9PAST|nr:hypothetical protein [Bisgaard Taxon 45]